MNQYVCIFIDAVDEANENFVLELDEFIGRVSKRKFKIIISCKDTEWGWFLKRLGNPTILSQNIYRTAGYYDAYNEKTKKEIDKQPGIFLRKFDEEELREAEQKYRQVYHFQGNLSGSLRNQCHLPFMLRVVAEVYQDSNTDLPADVNNIQLLNKYLEKKLEKMEGDKALRFLKEIGRIFLDEYKIDSHLHEFSGKISEEIIRNKLGLPLTEDLYPPLFSHGILTKSRDKSDRAYIGFYYSKVRDFIIAIHSIKLNTLSESDFKSILPKLFENPIGQDVVYWYYNATESSVHKRMLDEYIEMRALNYVMAYSEIIDAHFYNTKDRFEPYTNGDIGIVLSNQGGVLYYSFRAITNEDKELVKRIPNLHELWDNSHEHIMQLGIHGSMYQTGIGFSFTVNPREKALKEIRARLENIVKNGNLNESNNYSISLEKVLVILDFWGESMQYRKLRDKRRGRNKFIPIDCNEILNLIKLDYARYYYRKQMEEEKIKTTCSTATAWTSRDYEPMKCFTKTEQTMIRHAES